MDLHTQIPAKVISVDYVKNSVTVQPLIKTYINKDQAIAFPQCIDVPAKLISNGKGGAKITIPFTVGRVGILKFSERDLTNWINGVGNEIVLPNIKDNLSMGVTLYPMSFEMGLFTPASAIDWDSENIVIQHGDNFIKLPLTKGQPILINDAQVTSTGNIITKNGTDLDQLKADFDAHLHSGVQSGSSSTGGIVIP